MLADAASGQTVDLGPGPTVLDSVESWGPERTIRASVLRHLLTEEEWPVDSQGILLRRIRIRGNLYLPFATLRCPLMLEACYLDNVIVNMATISLLSLTGCRLGGLAGGGLIAKGLNLSGSTLVGPFSLRGAQIGYVECIKTSITGRDQDGNALVADHAEVAGSVSFAQGTADGVVRLSGAAIGGQLVFRGFTLKGHDINGNALFAERIKADSGIYLDQGFTAPGAVRLHGANAEGLVCSGANLAGSDREGNSLVADGIRISGGAFFDENFTTAGAVRLHSADIGVQLAFRGARLNGRDTEGNALVADGARIGGSVFLDQDFKAAGTVSLKSVSIGGSLGFMPGAQTDLEHPIALDAARMKIAGALRWAPATRITGPVNLQNTAVGQLEDDWATEKASENGYWPTNGLLCLHEFTYDALGGDHRATTRQRIEWIRSQYRVTSSGKPTAFSTQPYELLAKLYQQSGQDREARAVAIARRADLRRFGDLSWHRKISNLLLDKTIKYGYETWRALVLLAIVYLAFLSITILAQHNNAIVPVQNLWGIHPVPSATSCTSNYPCFYPLGYAIDTVIPIVNVHQADYWGLDGSVPWGWAWVASAWVATGLGWALVTLLVAGYTGLVRTR